jgi:putative glutamine amidotransferase
MAVLVVNDKADMGRSYFLPFAFLGPKTEDVSLLETNPQSISLVVFTGGSDVSPSLYNDHVCNKTHTDPERDEQEFAIFNQAINHNIPMFGICRGLQFLTAMLGGKLIQHTHGHHKPHPMKTKDGMEFYVTSSHHQMVLPSESDEVLAWSSSRLSDIYIGGNNQPLPVPKFEIEAVRFKHANAIGVQYHPEIMDAKCPGFYFVEDMIRRYFPSLVN